MSDRISTGLILHNNRERKRERERVWLRASVGVLHPDRSAETETGDD